MSYVPVPVDTFGGLDLSTDPEQVGLGGAVSMHNLDPAALSEGTLAGRRGLSSALATNGGRHPVGFGRTAATGDLVVAWDNGDVTAHASNGTLRATMADFNATDFTAFGTPTTSCVYFAAGGLLYKWDVGAGTFTTVTLPAGFQAFHVSVATTASRLVIGGTIDNTPTVFFSEPGLPDTIPDRNKVGFDPGTGQQVLALATWQEQVFVFLDDEFFVLYGESVSGTGTPIFNYRSVRSRIGVSAGQLAGITPKRAVAGPDGVYFYGGDGVYRTSGGNASKVSGAIDAWFRNRVGPLAGSLPTWTGDVVLSSDTRYVYFATRSQSFTFVFDTITDQWLVWTGRVVGVEAADANQLVATDSAVCVAGGTTDLGVTVTWDYRSGLSDLGSPGRKAVRAVRAWGTGAPTLSVYTDHATSDASAATVTLGASPAVTDAQQRVARRGTFFGFGFSGSAPAAVNRVVLDVRDRRGEGLT